MTIAFGNTEVMEDFERNSFANVRNENLTEEQKRKWRHEVQMTLSGVLL